MPCQFSRRLQSCQGSSLKPTILETAFNNRSVIPICNERRSSSSRVVWRASVPSFMSDCLLVTHSPTAGVSYSVCRMLSRSFDDAIVMQIVTCHNHVGQKSVLLVTDQPRSRYQRMSSSPPAQGSSPRSFS
jgi:hypothetical protein